MNYKNVLTVCPYCGCGCGIYQPVIEGELKRPIPDQTHQLNEGKLCIKGWSAHEHVTNPDRLTSPLIRKGNNFEESSWDEALSLVSSRLLELKEQHGIDIDKKKMQLSEPIKSLGTTIVPIKVHPKVTAEVKVKVKEA